MEPQSSEEVKHEKKKTKLFNKLYTDMQNAINYSLKKQTKIHTVSYNAIKQFEKFIDTNHELYVKMDDSLFKTSVLLSRVLNGKVLSTKNKEVVWKYIQAMYSLAKEQNKELDIVVKHKDGLEGLVGSLMKDDSQFKDIVQDITSQLQNLTAGKEIDQQQIINDLLKGNLQSSGIDFKKIIEDTSKTITEKINDGQIDKESIIQTGNKLKNLFETK